MALTPGHLATEDDAPDPKSPGRWRRLQRNFGPDEQLFRSQHAHGMDGSGATRRQIAGKQSCGQQDQRNR